MDYKARPIAEQLAEAAPDGIDVYVDNVGGDHLRAAIAALRDRGRIGMVGAISSYNATEPVPGSDNLFDLSGRNATLRGTLINFYLDLFPEWIERAAAWIADGSLHYEQTVVDGLERAPHAFLRMLKGANTGKMLVRLTDRTPSGRGSLVGGGLRPVHDSEMCAGPPYRWRRTPAPGVQEHAMVQPTASTAARTSSSSTGPSVRMLTRPCSVSTSTPTTPGTWMSSSLMAARQCPRVSVDRPVTR
nr:zinc-binding dehydrogenase [Nonomuraea sp. FMUSA5-5]